MTRITNSDQVLLLLRSHLERQSKIRKPDAKKAEQSNKTGHQSSPIDRTQSILSQSDLSDDKLSEILVTGLLSEEFGSGVASDPQFSGLVREVVQAIKDMDGGEALLAEAIRQISDRGSAQ